MGVAKILHVDFWPQEKTWSPFTTYRLCILAVAGKVNPWVEPLMWNFALFTLHSAQFLSVSGTHFPPILAPNRFGRNCRCSFCQPRRKGFKDSSCRVGNLFVILFHWAFGKSRLVVCERCIILHIQETVYFPSWGSSRLYHNEKAKEMVTSSVLLFCVLFLWSVWSLHHVFRERKMRYVNCLVCTCTR